MALIFITAHAREKMSEKLENEENFCLLPGGLHQLGTYETPVFTAGSNNLKGAERAKEQRKTAKKKKFRVAILSRTCQGKAEKWRSRIPRCGALADVKPCTKGERLLVLKRDYYVNSWV